MQTVRLSQLVLAVSPELYELLTEAELGASVLVHGELSGINRDDINRIVAQTIAYHHGDKWYH
ncbi:MAG: hypothetical protein WBZ33_09145 [Thermoactinomyces sp.]|jgi:hypothetical protein